MDGGWAGGFSGAGLGSETWGFIAPINGVSSKELRFPGYWPQSKSSHLCPSPVVTKPVPWHSSRISVDGTFLWLWDTALVSMDLVQLLNLCWPQAEVAANSLPCLPQLLRQRSVWWWFHENQFRVRELGTFCHGSAWPRWSPGAAWALSAQPCSTPCSLSCLYGYG